MTKEDFVNEIFMTALNISLFSLPHKELLINIGKDEVRRQAAIRHLKDLCSDINFLLNGLRSDDDFKRYSKDYLESHRRWVAFLKQSGIKDDPAKLQEYQNIMRRLVALFDT